MQCKPTWPTLKEILRVTTGYPARNTIHLPITPAMLHCQLLGKVVYYAFLYGFVNDRRIGEEKPNANQANLPANSCWCCRK